MNNDTMLHILRNPYGHSEESVREARLQAANIVERVYNGLKNIEEMSKKRDKHARRWTHTVGEDGFWRESND